VFLGTREAFQATFKYSCARGVFEELMDKMEDVQLRVEAMMTEVEIRDDLFGNTRSDIQECLSKAEEYLRKLLHQYEQEYANRRDKKENELIQLSKDLVGFIAPRRSGSEVDAHYFVPASNVQVKLIKLIASKSPIA
jgi:septation ring formation regulator EzrA